jgi:arabinogalactan oligomer/maltooligosaccharide transport system substrate-binding protein
VLLGTIRPVIESTGRLEYMKSRTRIIALFAGVAASLAAVTGSASGAPAKGTGEAATPTITVWVDNVQKPAVDRIADAWGRQRGVTVNAVVKDFGKIRDDLKTVSAENAPDVIVGPHDWVGELAANGLIVPLSPSRATRTQFPSYSLDAFSYGRSVKRLYGAPFALENVGLVVNTRLARVPTSFADFQKQALAFKRKARGNIALAVPQGSGGDAYHMYPFFSGLGGYVFGKNRVGNLDPRNIGLVAPRFLRNTPMIDTWNRLGLINSKIDYGTGKDAFLNGKAAFWITGPWETNTLKESNLRFRIVQLPRIKYRSVPFLGVQGYMVTRYAATHGVQNAAKDLVASYMMRSASQTALAGANGRFPANTTAGRRVRDSVLLQFGRAGAGGVPMPNIPQMASVWSELGGAWVKSTKGAGATRARVAFTAAARNISNKIG